MKKNLLILPALCVILMMPLLASEPFTDRDYPLAGITFNDSLEKVKILLGPLTLVDTYVNEIAACEVKIYKAKDVKVSIASIDEGKVWSVEVFSPNYATQRGIKVGNSSKKVTDKYGEPDYKDSFKDKNGKTYIYWTYENTEKMRRLVFKIDKAKNVVSSITSAMIID
ncbi:MAG: hypothetical protein ABRQ37_12475 [Candidatus Eremiobacterota bacterium]